jgi:hypothetical protein
VNPAEIIALVQMVIQFLLQLFGKQPASVADYIAGRDVGTIFRPFVMAYRKQKLKAFVNGYAVLHGLNAEQAYDAVLIELKKMGVADIVKVAATLPSK